MSLIDDAISVRFQEGSKEYEALAAIRSECVFMCEPELAALKALWLSRAQKPVEWYVPSSTLTYVLRRVKMSDERQSSKSGGTQRLSGGQEPVGYVREDNLLLGDVLKSHTITRDKIEPDDVPLYRASPNAELQAQLAEKDRELGVVGNNYVEAIKQIIELEAKLEMAKEALEEVINSGLLQGSYTIHNEANKAVHKALQIILIEESKDE